MNERTLERAKQRLADHAARRSPPEDFETADFETADFEAGAERARDLTVGAAAATAEQEAALAAEIRAAVRDAIRSEVVPVGRHIAEIRGLLNQTIRRLERLEGELLAERHARVDDLGLLVELVSSGWRGVDARLAALERRRQANDTPAAPSPAEAPAEPEPVEAPADSEPELALRSEAAPAHALQAHALPTQAEHAEALAGRAAAA